MVVKKTSKIFLLLFFLITTGKILIGASELFKYRKKITEECVEKNALEDLRVALEKNKDSLKINERDQIIKDSVFRLLAQKTTNYKLLTIFYEFSSKKQKKELYNCYGNFLKEVNLVTEVKQGKIDFFKLLFAIAKNKEEKQNLLRTQEENKAQKFSHLTNISELLAIIEPHLVDAMDSGRQLLSIASKNNDWEAIKSFVEAGVDLDHQDEWGWTALMYAAAGGYDKTVSFLTKAGAKTDIQNKWGETAYALAADLGYEKVLALLPQETNSIAFVNNRIEVLSKEQVTSFFSSINNHGSDNLAAGAVCSVIFFPVAPVFFALGGREAKQAKHLAELIQVSFIYLGMYSKPVKAQKQSSLEKFYFKYIKSSFVTKLTLKLVAAEIALASYIDLFYNFDHRGYSSISSSDLYQNDEIVNSIIPYGKKGEKIKKGEFLDLLQYRLFSNGKLANLTKKIEERWSIV